MSQSDVLAADTGTEGFFYAPLAPSTRSAMLRRAHSAVETSSEQFAKIALYGSLVVVYAWFGGMKFTAYEAAGLVDLVGNSPILSWAYSILSVDAFSSALGIVEIGIAILIAGRLLSPKLSLVGGLLSSSLFFTTLSLMASTPGVFEQSLGFPAISVAPGQFLLKDVGLLAISLWIAVESFKAGRATRAAE